MALDMSVAYKIAAQVTGQQAVDKLKTSMTGLERAGVSASKGFESLKGAALGLAAGFSALTVIQQATQAIREEEVAQGRLNALLKATQFSAGLTAKELGNLADSIEDVAGQFNGEQIRNGISTLLRFGNIGGEVFKEATRLSVDLAAALGTDVSGAAERLGRALTDPTENLGRLDSQLNLFTPTQEEFIEGLAKAGKQAEAQAAILEILRDRLGDTAEEMNTGLNKQLAAADRAYGDFLKTVGNSPAIQGAVEGFFTFLTSEVNELDRVIREKDFLNTLFNFSITESTSRILSGSGNAPKTAASGKTDSEFDPQELDAILGAALAAQRAEEDKLAEAARKRKEEAEKAAEAAAKEAVARAKSFSSLLISMDEEIAKTEELSRVQLEEQRIALGKYGALTAAQRASILQKAAEIDASNALKKADDEAAKAAEKRRSEAERAFQAQQSEIQQLFEDTRTPIENLSIELERLQGLFNTGQIDVDLFTRGVAKAKEEAENTKTGFEELEDAIRGFGNQATDAIVGFVTGAKTSFRSLVDSVLQDLIRLTVQKGITGPLFGAISSAAGGLFGGSTGGNLVGDFFSGLTLSANGNVMTGAGPMRLQKYASGGIATSPQLAMFGEGTTPEAFVPLPDGRSIPVTVQGGMGGNTTVTVNVAVESGSTQTQGNSERAGNLGRVVAGVVREELLKQKRPGGLLAAG